MTRLEPNHEGFSLERMRERISTYQSELLDDVVPFWLQYGLDRQHGGVMTCLHRDGSVIDTDKGLWQQGRFAWLMGKLYNEVEQRGEWLEAALSTLDFLETHGFDPSDGRMWFHVTREGQPLRKRRYAFTESFAAIAFAEVARATGREDYARRAEDLLRTFVRHHEQPLESLAKYTTTRPTRSLGYPMILIVTAQELRDSIQLEIADELIDRGIELLRDLHLKSDLECVLETVGEDGRVLDHFDGRTLNPGHAIEGAWFMLREAQHRGDRELQSLGCQMLDWMWRRGWDEEFGGILYFVDVHGLPVQEYWHDMKFWWPQNEAEIAMLLAFSLTRDSRYAGWYEQIHAWSREHFVDREHGEWFGYLHRDGRLSTPLKGNLWKGPFHIPRMQLTCWQILERLQAESREG